MAASPLLTPRGPASPYHEFYCDDFAPRDHYRPLWEHVRRTGQALLSDKAREAHLTSTPRA